jgi:hypothetical protein
MNCRTCEKLLVGELDAEAADALALHEHLRGCAGCARLRRDLRHLGAGLARLRLPAPPPHLTAAITARLTAEARRQWRRRRWRRMAGAALAVAAGLLVALVGLRLWPRPQPAGPASPDVARSEPAGEKPPPLRESLGEAGSALASLTTRTAGATVGETARLLPMVPTPPVPAGDVALEPPTRLFREAGAEVSAGLGPVTDSARRAVGLFLRDLPMGGEEARGEGKIH